MRGRLYLWQTALIACPTGWHLPGDEEWKTLEMYLGMSQSEADDISWRGTDEGTKLKSTSGWHQNGNCNGVEYDKDNVDRYDYQKEYGFSVRCVRDLQAI